MEGVWIPQLDVPQSNGLSCLLFFLIHLIVML
jgi:hypothetical protein